ncbi:hypothetical protein BJ742DRAFT_849067 [Cladochytrium replicatum]|nr:hypothetical protein BJ742DRAFT_849067 [Cladochytrium replicatum]
MNEKLDEAIPFSATVRTRRSGWFGDDVDKDEETEKVKQMVRRNARPQSFDVDDSEIESAARDIASGRLSHRGSVTTTANAAGELLHGTKSLRNRDQDFEDETKKDENVAGKYTRGTLQSMAAHRRRNSSSNIRAALMMDRAAVEKITGTLNGGAKFENDANECGGLGISTPEATGRRHSRRNKRPSGLNISIGDVDASSLHHPVSGASTEENGFTLEHDKVIYRAQQRSYSAEAVKNRAPSDSKPVKPQIRRASCYGSAKHIAGSSGQTNSRESETLAHLQELDRLHSQLKTEISQFSEELATANRDITRCLTWTPHKGTSSLVLNGSVS